MTFAGSRARNGPTSTLPGSEHSGGAGQHQESRLACHTEVQTREGHQHADSGKDCSPANPGCQRGHGQSVDGSSQESKSQNQPDCRRVQSMALEVDGEEDGDESEPEAP